MTSGPHSLLQLILVYYSWSYLDDLDILAMNVGNAGHAKLGGDLDRPGADLSGFILIYGKFLAQRTYDPKTIQISHILVSILKDSLNSTKTSLDLA